MNLTRFTPYQPFNAASYAENDAVTRLAVSGWLVGAGWVVLSSGLYDVDFDARRPDGSVCHVEVDRRLSARWRAGEPFPFPDYQLGSRKRELLGDPAVVFVTANKTLDRWIAAPAAVFAASGSLVAKSFGGGEEEFMSVPVAACRQGSLQTT